MGKQLLQISLAVTAIIVGLRLGNDVLRRILVERVTSSISYPTVTSSVSPSVQSMPNTSPMQYGDEDYEII